MALLEVKGLSKYYDRKPVVNKVSFQFQEGRCIALIGPNGAGKTTVLRTLAGLLKPTEGIVKFNGRNPNSDIRPYIGYLPQHPVFYPWMTGSEFLRYSGRLSNLPKEEAKKRSEELLDVVGISQAKSKRIGKYSGGMKQRLGIAQAMIHKPQLLMLDEPVSALDPIGRREILTLMEELKEELTILFSTHILSDADEVSDELLLLHKGEIVESGLMDTLRRKYQTEKLELTFTENAAHYREKIHKLETVENTDAVGSTIEVHVSDVVLARKEILQVALKEDWPLSGFVIKQASLEDMFMKAVN
ncbi:MAG TPA: ABC transporter ATP-binding protein [Bacillota bacterium]|nr:ABC transporter ATP-binding protein [Bacillota bacterium]